MKKLIVSVLLVLLAVFLLIGLIPFSKEIAYSGTAYETYGRGFGVPTGNINPICMGLCLAKMCCPYC